jgi:protein tyrosine/serine phosphatase
MEYKPHVKKKEEGVLPSLCPPAKFGIVEAKIYRFKSPIYDFNFAFLQQLKPKTMLRLSPDLPTKAITTWLQENNIELIHLGLKTLQHGRHRSDSPITFLEEEIIKEGLEIILDVKRHPVLITCSSGVHQTGTLVGCLRRLMGYNLTFILEECRSYGTTRFTNEQFIELFDCELITLPKNLPDWFIEHQRMKKEEEEEEEEQEQEQEQQID